MTDKSANETADQILKLLDVGLKAVQRGDADVALMSVRAAVAKAKTLPTKAICLPDRSAEKI